MVDQIIKSLKDRRPDDYWDTGVSTGYADAVVTIATGLKDSGDITSIHKFISDCGYFDDDPDHWIKWNYKEGS